MANGRLSRKYLDIAREFATSHSDEEIQIIVLANLFWLEDRIDHPIVSDRLKSAFWNTVSVFIATAAAWSVIAFVWKPWE